MTVLPLGREPETQSEGWEQQKLKALGSPAAATLVVGLEPVLSFPCHCPSMGLAPRSCPCCHLRGHGLLAGIVGHRMRWLLMAGCWQRASIASSFPSVWTTGPTPVGWACVLSGLLWSHFGKPFPLLIFPATLLMVLQFSTGGYMGPWGLNCSSNPHRTGPWIFKCHVPIVTGPAPLESTRWVG